MGSLSKSCRKCLPKASGVEWMRKQIGCDKYSMVPYIYIILYLLVLYIYITWVYKNVRVSLFSHILRYFVPRSVWEKNNMRPWISLDHLSQRGLRVMAWVKFGPTKMFFIWFVPNLAINVYSITATIKHQDNIVLGCFGVHSKTVFRWCNTGHPWSRARFPVISCLVSELCIYAGSSSELAVFLKLMLTTGKTTVFSDALVLVGWESTIQRW